MFRLAGIGLVLAVSAFNMFQETVPKPPVAKKLEKITKIHGETVVDDYFWLRDKSNPEVVEYLKAEDSYADSMMVTTKPFQDALYKEMLGRIKETDVNVPYKNGDYYYYSRTVEGKQYPIMARKKGSLHGAEEITLELNEMAKDQKFLSVGAYQVSNDGNLLAYTTDTTGFRQYNLFVKDLRTGKVSEPLNQRVTSVAWGNDNKTLFYTQEDDVTKRSNKFFRHKLGGGTAELLFEEKDELYNIVSGRTRSKGYIVLVSASSTTSEARYISADQPDGQLKLVLARKDGHEYYLDHLGDRFYIRTNDKGKNFRVVTAPLSDPGPANWKEIIPHSKDVMIEDIDCFADQFVTVTRKNGIPQIDITDVKSGTSHEIEFPEPVYVVSPQQNLEFHTKLYRINYQSFITPESIYDYDVKTRKLELLKQQPVLGGYDPKLYQSERVYATATDGTRIPISMVYRKDPANARPVNRPFLLEGYGSYGISNDVDFSSNRLSLLDRGVVFGIAHIRGGGELGKEWHDQGKMMVKRNTFTDFIASAEHLINEKYTSRDKLIIMGGSAGGLLMGAVTNMRPDLFKAVMTYVPFVDVMNTMLDASLPLTVGEYLEWGNPNEKPAYDYMKSYSPYDNVARKDYPDMLVRSSLNDSQVMYWEPAKYVAKLRTMKTDHNVLLFKVKTEPGGHGGASGRYDRLHDMAFDYAFMLREFGITK